MDLKADSTGCLPASAVSAIIMSQVSSLQSVDIEANDRSFTGQDAAVLVSLHRLDEAQLGMERFEQRHCVAGYCAAKPAWVTHSHKQCRCSRLVWFGAAGGVQGTAEPELHIQI